MIRNLIFFACLVGLSLLVAWLADHPGTTTIEWMGYRIETTFFFLSLLLALTTLFLVGACLLGYSIVAAPRRLRESRFRKRRERGMDALTQTFIALASDDSATAKRMLHKADQLLEAPAITLLLSTQLARLQGDDTRTRALLQKMLQRKETAFLAARSLLNQANANNAPEEALTYARKAFELKPKDPQVAISLIEALIRSHHWQEALQLTEKSRRRRLLKSSEAHRLLAILHFNEGKRIYEEGSRNAALRFLVKSHKLQPGFVPAATLLASLQASLGKKGAAVGVLRQCWKASHHPEVITALQALYPDDTAEKSLKRMEKFTQISPDHSETLFTLAQADMKAKNWQSARNHLKILLSREETVRLCKLMAELEKKEHNNEARASDWLLRASSADPDPAWVCGECSHISDEWIAFCPQCFAFDSIAWKQRNLSFVKENKDAA